MTVITNADYRKRIERETDGFHRFMTARRVKVGEKRVFIYPHWGTPDCHPDYTAHRFHVVKVLRHADGQQSYEDSEPMFKIKAGDGWTGIAWACELFPLPKGRLS